MSLLSFIILIFVVLGKSRAAVRPVISASSDWGKIFSGDSITLTCNADSDPENYLMNSYYHWYKDTEWKQSDMSSYTIHYAQSRDSGDYTCSLSNGVMSDPFTLKVTSGTVILQTPPVVYEGDSPSLRCHQRNGNTASNIFFYKGEEKSLQSVTGSVLQLTHVAKLDSGTYSCSKRSRYSKWDRDNSDTAEITVRELFSDPEIKVSPYPLKLGATMTLTCDTRLAPPRAQTELRFAFYRNGQKVQDFGRSRQYRVKSAVPYHSGNYTCDARTSSESVKKSSRWTNLRIEGAASRPVVSISPDWGKVFTGESLTLTCTTDPMDQTDQRYYWYKDALFIQGVGKTFTIKSAETRDTGEYRCQTRRGGLSDPIKLDVSTEAIILQTPTAVYEGDSLRVRCRYREGDSHRYRVISKDNKYIKSLYTPEFLFGVVGHSDAGSYKCKSGSHDVASAHMTVADLFSDPEIKVSPYPVTEGAAVTLTCDTHLAPPRAQTELWYTFYKNGDKLYSMSGSNKYEIPKLNAYRSGTYTCEARTVSGSVKKTSQKLEIKTETARPEILASPNTGKIFRGESITLTCNLNSQSNYYAAYKWYKGSLDLDTSEKTLEINFADLKDNGGDYHCTSSSSDKSDPFTLDVGDGVAVRPGISASPNTGKIFTGDSVTLTCNADSLDEGSQAYYWYKGRDYIYYSGKSFTIHAAEREDSGDYQCRTDSGDRSDPFTLDVSDDVSVTRVRVGLKPPGGLVGEKERLDVTCSVDRGSGTLEFSWCRQDSGTCEEKQLTDSQEARFVVESVVEGYSGEYYCFVTVSKTQIRSETVRISVIVPVSEVTISTNIDDREMVAGDNVTFTCSMKRGSSPSFLWLHNGKEMNSQSGLYQIRESGKTLYIESISSHHEGTYQCLARNQVSPDRTFTSSRTLTISLFVPVSDVRIRADKEDLKMVAGANVTFTCSVERGSSPSFLWLHKEEKVDNKAGLYQIRDSGKTLYIESVSPEHEGTYKCQASNQVSHSRSFTAESKVLTISVSGKTIVLSLAISLIFLVVLLTITILVFIYRHKLSFIFTKCHRPEPRPGVFFAKARVRAAPRPQNETNHSHQEPLDSRNLPAKKVNEGDEVCYSYIDIRCRPQDSMSPRADNSTIVYATVQCPTATGSKPKDPHRETSGSCSNIYENFSST